MLEVLAISPFLVVAVGLIAFGFAVSDYRELQRDRAHRETSLLLTAYRERGRA